MSGTYDSLNEILTHIETDTVFRAFCIGAFNTAIERKSLSSRNVAAKNTSSLTPMIAEPENWDSVTWNEPVHVFVVLPSQEILYDSACRSEVLATYHIVCRFRSSASIQDVYDFVDELRNCIRRLDSDVSEPKWTNSGAEFFFTENEFPAARLMLTVEHRQSEDD
jgi:hypothetical protein